MDLRKKYQDACETLGWDVDKYDPDSVWVKQSHGEDGFGFNASVDAFVEAVRGQHDNFDVDKYVEMMLNSHPYHGNITDMLDEVAEARGNGEDGRTLHVMLAEAGDDAKDICDKLNEVAKARGDANVIHEVEGLLGWLQGFRSEAEGIQDGLKELAETLEGVGREQVDIKLTAYTNPAADIRLEGATLELADGREVYADFLGCDTEQSDIDWEYRTAEYLLEDVTFRDKKGGEEILLGADELRYAELKAVDVRCDREEGLYFEAESVDITAWDADSGRVQLMHDNSNSTLGRVDVHAADYGGNDWHISGHKPDRRPGLDNLIQDAQERAAAEGKDGKSKDRGKDRE